MARTTDTLPADALQIAISNLRGKMRNANLLHGLGTEMGVTAGELDAVRAVLASGEGSFEPEPGRRIVGWFCWPEAGMGMGGGAVTPVG